MAATPLLRAQAAAIRAIYALPTPLRRLIAGKPVRGQRQQLALDAQLLLRLQRLNGTTLSMPSVSRARRAFDGSIDLVEGTSIEPVVPTEITIPAQDNDIPATLYTPESLGEGSGLLVFYHGGGFVLGSRKSHDNTARFFAAAAQVRVLSVEYRLAPENRFPAAALDALAAFEYANAKASQLGADPTRIAVGGDSAGGNLAAVVACETARREAPKPAFQLLLYPTVDATVRRQSRERYGEGYFLTDTDITWFIDHYAPTGTDRADPLLSPLLSEDVSGVPPAYIATAGFDPLRDEGEAYARRLAESGVPVVLSEQKDLIHGFATVLGVGQRFREATAEAAGALQVGLTLAGSS